MSGWREKAVQEAAEAIDNLTHAETTLNGDWLESMAEAAVFALAPVVEAEVRRGRAEALRAVADDLVPILIHSGGAAIAHWSAKDQNIYELAVEESSIVMHERADAIEAGDPR